MGSSGVCGSGPKARVSSVRKKPPICCSISAFFFFCAGSASRRISPTPAKTNMHTSSKLCCTKAEMHPAMTKRAPSRMPMLSRRWYRPKAWDSSWSVIFSFPMESTFFFMLFPSCLFVSQPRSAWAAAGMSASATGEKTIPSSEFFRLPSVWRTRDPA